MLARVPINASSPAPDYLLPGLAVPWLHVNGTKAFNVVARWQKSYREPDTRAREAMTNPVIECQAPAA